MRRQAPGRGDRQLPELQDAIFSYTVTCIVIRMNGHAGYPGCMGKHRAYRLPGIWIPKSEGAINASTAKDLCRGCRGGIKGDGRHRTLMAWHTKNLLAIRRRPNLDRPILARPSKLEAVGTERQTVDGIGMNEFLEKARARHVPDLGGIVLAAGGQKLAILAENRAQDEVLMSCLPVERL